MFPHYSSICFLLWWTWLLTAAVGYGSCVEIVQGKQTSLKFNCMTPPKTKDNIPVEVPEALSVSCFNLSDVNFSFVSEFRNNFSSVTCVKFEGCPLFKKSYRETLELIGVHPSNLTSLILSIASRDGVVTKHHIQGLKELRYLELIGVHGVESDLFSVASKVEAIEIHNSTISHLPVNVFSNLTNLEILVLHSNNIDLPTELFAGTSGLSSISLTENEIYILPESLLKGLNNLKSLNISKNNIEKLSSGTFSDASEMESLDLSMNLISEIEDNTFSNMKLLKTLNLSYNKLKSLPSGAFKNCNSLEWLNLSNNNLVHPGITNVFPDPSSITYLDLGHNNITIKSLSNFSFNKQNKIKHLYLNNNNISVIPNDLNYLFNDLETLDLSWNAFEYLDYYAMIFLPKSVKLNLKHNKIDTFNFTPAFPLSRKKTISLALKGNNLVCDCNNYGFIRVLQGKSLRRLSGLLDIKVEDIEDVFCQFNDRKFVNLMEIKTEDLKCPLPSNDNCSYAWQPHYDMMLIDCSYLKVKSINSLNITTCCENLTLILANSSLISLDGLERFIDLVNLSVPYNRLSFINISHLPSRLKALDIRGNNLTTLPSTILNNLTDMTLKLGSNPWHCNCDLLDFFHFLHIPSNKVMDSMQLQCAENGEALMNLSEHDLCPFFLQPMVIVTIVSIIVFLIFFAVLGTASFYKYKQSIKVWLYAHHLCLWAITEDELDADKKYDAFISYSHKDEEFVMKQLVPGLECGEPKYRVCLHYRDWVPGEYIQNQIMESVEASRRTIIVLSSNFIESVWGQLEFRAAHSQALQDHTNRIIIIAYGKIPAENELDEQLKLYLTSKTYVRWSDSRFWEKLKYIMPHAPELIKKKHHKCRDTDKLELCNSPSKKSES